VLACPKLQSLRKWILTATIVTLPSCSLAQVQGRVDSGVQKENYTRFEHRQRRYQHYPRYPFSSCWRVTRMPNGVLRAWNCQPYP
jgi:hypothetical protein